VFGPYAVLFGFLIGAIVLGVGVYGYREGYNDAVTMMRNRKNDDADI